jgi:hypothetical protein
MTALDRGRLAKLLGMLGSDHDGEVVAAAKQAERLRRKAGITWAEIVVPAKSLASRSDHLEWPETTTESIELCIEHADVLSGWDKKFLASIARRSPNTLSEKQLSVLARMVRTIMAWRVAA